MEDKKNTGQMEENYSRYINLMSLIQSIERGKSEAAEVPHNCFNAKLEQAAKNHNYSVHDLYPAGIQEAEVVIIARADNQRDDADIADLFREMGKNGLFKDKSRVIAEGADGELRYDREAVYDHLNNFTVAVDTSEGNEKSYSFKKGHFVERLFDCFKEHEISAGFGEESGMLKDHRIGLALDINELSDKLKVNPDGKRMQEELKNKINDYMGQLDIKSRLFRHLVAGSAKYGKVYFVADIEDYALGSVANELKERKIPYIALIPDRKN